MTKRQNYRDEEHDLKIVTCNIPKKHLEYIRKLLEWGIVPSRSEYVRHAIADQISRDFETKKYVEEVIEADEIKVERSVKIPEGYDYVEGFNGNKPFKTTRLEY